MLVISRADGRSSVAAAAYAARTSMTDERTGRRYSYRSRPGLISEGLVGWNGTAEELWNAAEKAERRGNARVARELRPALPAELPLDEQHRLVRGMSLWFKDTYGVAVHFVVHAPTCYDRRTERRLWRNIHDPDGLTELHESLFDPGVTNLNFHAHIRLTVRKVDRETGAFGEKTRVLDTFKTGPEEVLRIRAEWERRTNQALKRNGSNARIDLRSYKQMAADGDAPEGLEAQEHLGPRVTAKVRAAEDDPTACIPAASLEREETRARNETMMDCWLTLRALAREAASLEGLSAEVAAAREAERRTAADAEKARIAKAKTEWERAEAIEQASSIDLPRGRKNAYQAAIAWAQGVDELPRSDTSKICPAGDGPGRDPDIDAIEFDREIDPETHEHPVMDFTPRNSLRVRRRSVERLRVRGG